MKARALLALAFAMTSCGPPAPTTPPLRPTPQAQPQPTQRAQAASHPIESRTVTISAPIASLCHIQFDKYESKPVAESSPLFAFDDAELFPDDRALLDKVATCMKTGPLEGRSVMLVGRADPRGETEYNMLLGARRAHSVANFLKVLGVAAPRVQETSRGELDATGTNEATWTYDRRVDILLL